MSTVIVPGNQISLRPYEEAITDVQVAQIYRWSGDPQVLRWSGGAPTDLSFAEFRERMLSDRETPWDNRLVFLIMTNTGALIGRVGIFGIDWQKRQGELGIAIGEPTYWGQGYGRDATMTLLRHVFETTLLERINLFTFVENVRAQQCFAACGFRSLSVARRFTPDLGEYDGIEMEITRDDLRRINPVRVLHQSEILITQDAS